MRKYFSDLENSPRARTDQMISPAVWKGLVGTVQALVKSGAFGLRFPERCLSPRVTKSTSASYLLSPCLTSKCTQQMDGISMKSGTTNRSDTEQ